MRKKKYYRLVKVEDTYISNNTKVTVDFIPELYTETTYAIERKIGWFGKWEIISSYKEDLKDIAEAYLAFYKSKPKKIVIK